MFESEPLQLANYLQNENVITFLREGRWYDFQSGWGAMHIVNKIFYHKIFLINLKTLLNDLSDSLKACISHLPLPT